MFTKNTFEKYATPISIVVAGLLVGGGIVASKAIQKPITETTKNSAQTETSVIAELTTAPILKKLGIKGKELSACITDKKTADKVDADKDLAETAGVRGTPHMIIIKKNTNGTETQFPLFGAQPKTAIEQAIAAGATPPEQSDYVESFAPQVITERDHIRGDKNAPVIVVEYSDIDCPFCKRLHGTLAQLVDEGKIAWVYRHSPIAGLHPFAYTKSLATECVALQKPDAFWDYLDYLMTE